MRILNRVKQPIFYAKYLGKEEIMDGDLRTGDYQIFYGETETAKVYISVPKVGYYAVSGEAKVGGEGVDTGYRHTIISEKDLGLTEEDIMWVGVPSVDGGTMWEGDYALDGGVFDPWEQRTQLNGGIFHPWTLVQEKIF